MRRRRATRDRSVQIRSDAGTRSRCNAQGEQRCPVNPVEYAKHCEQTVSGCAVLEQVPATVCASARRSAQEPTSGVSGQQNGMASHAGDRTDIVSRMFGPNIGVLEDPVTGAAHCALAPYWAKKLGKTSMSAEQASERGGTLQLSLKGDRVELTGQAVLYLDGKITV